MATYYDIPEQYGGMNLRDIQKATGAAFRPDILAGFAGIGETQPLTAGQTLSVNLPGNYASSGESSFLGQYLTPGVSPEAKMAQQAAQAKEQQFTQTLEQGKDAAISTLQAGKEPLKQRYDEIIASIKETGEEEIKKAEIATAREYGRKGILPASTQYVEAMQRSREPIQTALRSSYAGIGLQEEQARQARDFAIANIETATTREQVSAAMQLFELAENARLKGLTLEESARQFDEKIASGKEPGESSLLDMLMTLSEGQTVYNPSPGQPEYTAPKTYKATGTPEGGFNPANAE